MTTRLENMLPKEYPIDYREVMVWHKSSDNANIARYALVQFCHHFNICKDTEKEIRYEICGLSNRYSLAYLSRITFADLYVRKTKVLISEIVIS